MDSAASTTAARAFIEALYAPDEHIAVLAVKRGEAGPPVQRILTAERAAAEPFQRWLRHLNANSHDVFVGMNPFTGEARRSRDGRLRPMREKPDVARVRRLQLDLDSDGPDSLRRVLADATAGRLPPPAIVVRSSKDHYQVLWHTAEGWSPDEAEDTMARLAQRYDGDNVNDVARCMRLPGFRNKKQGRDDAAVTWTDYGGGPVRPEQFAHLPEAAERQRTPASARQRPRAGSLSQSERDWASVCDRLRRGDDPVTVAAELHLAEARLAEGIRQNLDAAMAGEDTPGILQLGALITAHLQNLWAQIQTFFFGVTFFAAFALIYALCLAQVIWAQVALGILVYLGPVLIPWLVWQPMAFLFWGWFKAIWTYSFYSIIAAAVLRIFVAIAITLIESMNVSAGVGQPPTEGPEAFQFLMAVVPLLAAAFMAALKVPELASAIVGSSSGGGIAGAAAMAMTGGKAKLARMAGGGLK